MFHEHKITTLQGYEQIDGKVCMDKFVGYY